MDPKPEIPDGVGSRNDDDAVHVNPSAFVARSDRSWSAWVPGTTQYAVLTPARLELLCRFLSPRGAAEAGATDRRAEVAELLACGLLIDATRTDTRTARIDVRPIERVAPARVDGGTRLALAPNFVLAPHGDGLRFWSSKEQAHVGVRADVLPLLAGFLEPRAVAEARDEDADLVGRLVACGVLLGEGAAGTPDVGQNITSIRLRDIVVGARRPAAAGDARPDAEADDPRTPIYPIYCLKRDLTRTHLPLALGMILSYVESRRGGALAASYRVVPRLLMTPAAVDHAAAEHGAGVFLFSDYVWNVDHNLAASKRVKERFPSSVTIHGGPSAPKYPEACERFLREHEHVDIVVRGEGEVTTAEILERLAGTIGAGPDLDRLRDVAGITFRGRDGAVRTPDRERLDDLSVLPSPYLNGHFDHDGFRTNVIVAAILETNRGCPYGCTYCDWGSATLQKIRRFDLDRIRSEIQWMAERRIPIIFCADANFGILDRDMEIAGFIADCRKRFGFPREFVVNYAKNATRRVADIVRTLRDAEVSVGGVISIQTTDPTTLDNVRRSNIKTERYDDLVREFKALKLPISTDLMMGLPGATVESFKTDLEYFFDKEIYAKAYSTTLLPNSPMADPAYLAEFRIEVDEAQRLVSTTSYTREERAEMDRIYLLYHLFEGYSLLNYALRFLQLEHGVVPMEYLHALDRFVRAQPDAYPYLTWVIQGFRSRGASLGGWRPFFEEIADYTRTIYGIAPGSAFDTVLRVQEAVLPEGGRTFPDVVELEHDFVRYFLEQYRRVEGAAPFRPLASYPSGRMVVTDPDGISRLDVLGKHHRYEIHSIRWELHSPLTRIEEAAHFLEFDVVSSERPAPEIGPWGLTRPEPPAART